MSDQNPIVDIKFNITESGTPEVSSQNDHTTDTGGAATAAANKIADKASAKTAFVNPFAGGVNPFAPSAETQDPYAGSHWATMGRIPKFGRTDLRDDDTRRMDAQDAQLRAMQKSSSIEPPQSMFEKLLKSKIVGDAPLSLTDRPSPLKNSDGTDSQYTPSEEGVEKTESRKGDDKHWEGRRRKFDKMSNRPIYGTPEYYKAFADRDATNRQKGIDAGYDPDENNRFNNPFNTNDAFSYFLPPPITPSVPILSPPSPPVPPVPSILAPLIPPGETGSHTPPVTPPTTPTIPPVPPVIPPRTPPPPTPPPGGGGGGPIPPVPPPTPPPGGGGPPGRGGGGIIGGAVAGAIGGSAAGPTGAIVGAIGGAIAGATGGMVGKADAALSMILLPFHSVVRHGVEPMLKGFLATIPVLRHFQEVMDSVHYRFGKDKETYRNTAPVFSTQLMIDDLNLQHSRFSDATGITSVSSKSLDAFLAERAKTNTKWQQNSEDFGAELSKLLYRELNPVSTSMTEIQGELARTGKAVIGLLGKFGTKSDFDDKGLVALSLDKVAEALDAFNTFLGLPKMGKVNDIQKQLYSDLDAIFNGPDLNGPLPGKGRIPKNRKKRGPREWRDPLGLPMDPGLPDVFNR